MPTGIHGNSDDKGNSPNQGSAPDRVETIHNARTELSTSHPKLAALVAMSNTVQLTLEEVTNQFPEVMDRLERDDVRVVITKHGQPAAVILSVDELESIEETLAVLSSPDVMSDIDAARVERDADTTTRRHGDTATRRHR